MTPYYSHFQLLKFPYSHCISLMNMSKMSMGKIPLFTEISEVAQVVLGAGVTQLETRGTQKFPRNFFLH